MYEKVTHIEGKRCKRPCETTVCQFFADVVLHIKPLFSASVRQRDSWLAPNLSLYTWHNVKTHRVLPQRGSAVSSVPTVPWHVY